MSKKPRRSLVSFVALASTTLVVLAAWVGSSAGSTSTAKAAPLYPDDVVIGYLTPSATITRWASFDVPEYKKAIKKYAPKAKVLYFQANGDVATQLQQAKSAITQGAKVLVVASANSTQSGGLAAYANKAGVPIVVVERTFNNADTCCMVGSDSYNIGVTEGKWMAAHTKDGDTVATVWGDPADDFAVKERKGFLSVFQPLVDAGKRKVVGDVYTPGWLPDNAKREMDSILTKANDDVQGVVAANDDMAQSIIAALDAAHLGGGKIPVVGIDATLPGVQAIAAGRQSMTVYRPYTSFASVAAQATGYLLAKKPFPAGLFPGKLNNGKKVIPYAPAPSVAITKANLGDLISQGVYTKAQVCARAVAGVPACK